MFRIFSLAAVFCAFFAINSYAQKPNISYSTPQTVYLNKPIVPIQVNNAGGAVPNVNFPRATKFLESQSTVDRFVILPSGDIYGIWYAAVIHIKPDGSSSTLAGGNQYGYADGTGANAMFSELRGITYDTDGNIYVSENNNRDWLNSRVRKITPAGVVTTCAQGLQGPAGIAIDANGIIYAAEASDRILKIAKDGTTSLLAGQIGYTFADGKGAAAAFNVPSGIALDKTGNLYVADYSNNLIRKVTPEGVVTTVAGSKKQVSEDGRGTAASFYAPSDIRVDSKGNIFVGELEDVVRKITPEGDVFSIRRPYYNEQGNVYDPNLTSRLAIDKDDNLILSIGNGFGGYGFARVATTGYSVYPALPAGVKLGADGSIIGTPSQLLYKSKYNITASNDFGMSLTPVELEVVLSNDPPGLTSYTPAQVIRGQNMNIYGSFLTGTTAITIGGKPAPYFQVDPSGNTIYTYAPPDAENGDITVTTPYGTASLSGFQIVPPPVITSITPSTGYKGLKVTITGSGFTDVYSLTFGNYGTAFTVISPTEIEATLGSGAPGDVVISARAGTGTITGFTYMNGPSVTSASPGRAGTGTSVVIKGADFTGATSVKFGTVEATSFKIDAANQITAIVPSGAASSISVTTPYGTFIYYDFIFAPPPTIVQASPLKGGPNTTVNIYGSNLTGAQVSIGGVPARLSYFSDYQLMAVVGSGATSGDITVTTTGGTATLPGFVVVPPPVITAFAPQTAGIGDKVIITGTALDEVDYIQFGGEYASFKILSPTSIEATVGNGSSGFVSVTSEGGTGTLNGFTHKGPAIYAFTPTTAGAGETVNITGNNFIGTTKVSFGGVPAKAVTVLSATQITAVVDNGKSGNVSVTTPFGTALKDGFSHPGPAINQFSPTYAGALSPGPIIIYGANFTGATAVTFGGQPATSFTVNSSTTITATPPAGASGDVVVVTPKGTDKQPGFIWAGEPVITSFTPNAQKMNGMVTITGQNFVGVRSVKFGGVFSYYFYITSPTTIVAYVGTGASGDIEVAAVGGTVTAPGFVYTSSSIESISPTTAAAGQTVIITGSNFVDVQSVKFGGVNAVSFSVESPAKITAVVPVGGDGQVVVTTANGTVGGPYFTLMLPPTIYAVSPDKGGKGTLVTINGTRLASTTEVKFGNVAAIIINKQENSVQVKVGTGETGSVTVTTPAGSVSFGAFKWYPAPVITSVDPLTANAQTQVTITGENFNEVTELKFGGVATGWTEVAPNKIVATPLYGATGDISITALGGTTTFPGFKFIDAPTIASFTKTGEGANSTITLTGTNFNQVTAVTFGGVPAKSYTVNSATGITAQPGTGATGLIAVTAIGGTGTIRGYLYNSPPSIISFSPAFGPIGSTVTITGNNFNTDAAKNVVYFGPVKATVKAASKTSLQVTVPGGATGQITVANTAVGLSAISNLGFNVTNTAGATVSFANKLDVPLINTFGSYAIDDFDGDGFADILVARADSVYIRLHGSDPALSKSSFSKKVVLISNRQILDLVVGDIDGDGKKDILLGALPSIVLLRNTSTGSEVSFEQKTLESLNTDGAMSLRDIDMDGRPDLIIESYYGGCYPNTTLGTNVSFGAFVPLISSSGGATMALGFTDIDGDTNPEPIRSSSYGVTELYKNNSVAGDLSANDFTPSYIHHLTSYFYYSADIIMSADMDGDGKSDIVENENTRYNLQISRNIANGPVADQSALAQTQVFSSSFIPYYMSIADMDGDGKSDVIGASNYDIGFIRNQSTPGNISMASPLVIVASNNQHVAAIKATDMDADGRMDVVLNNTEAQNLVIYHNGPTVTPQITAVSPLKAKAGDKITLTGKHFDATTTVKFGNTDAASFIVISHEKIEAILGGGSSGAIAIQTPNGPASFLGFVMVDGPSITSAVAATDGSGILTITGSNLLSAKSVSVGGVPAKSFRVESDSRITASFAGVSGLLAVTTDVGTATLDNISIKENTVLTFGPFTSRIYGDADAEIIASSTNASTAVSYSLDKARIVTLTGGKLHIVGVGTVVITASQAADDLHNAPASVQQTLVINKKGLQVKANDKTRSFGKANPELTLEYSGFVNGEDKTKLAVLPVVATPAVTLSPVGVYDITVSGGVADNYVFTYTPGKLTVTPSATNFKLAASTITCRGQNNGAINITAPQTASYKAVVTGTGFSKIYSFTTTAAIENLAAGTYNVCVSDNALPDYKQCFDLVITEPKDLSVYTVVNPDRNTVEIALDGGAAYNITLNGVVYKTNNNSITLPLARGSNKLLISTDKLCQGVVERIVNLSGNTVPYPGPFQDVLHVNIGISTVEMAMIRIYNVSNGALVFTNDYANRSGVLNLDVSGLRPGVYSLHLFINNKKTVYKIIKK